MLLVSAESLPMHCSPMARMWFQYWSGKFAYQIISTTTLSLYPYLPIPPMQKLFDLVCLVWVIKQFEDTVIKSFGICWQVSTRKYLSRRQGKAALRQSVISGWTFVTKRNKTKQSYLRGDIGDRSFRYTQHPVNARVTRTRSPRLINVYWTRRSENMFVGLQSIMNASPLVKNRKTDRDENPTT